MFLAIPILALAKVVLDNIEQLKPWGELIGDNMTKTVKWKHIHWPKMD
jgi:predicted PurR-regulated permease PerM